MAEKKPFKDLTDEEADKLISTRGNPNLDSPVSHAAPPQTAGAAPSLPAGKEEDDPLDPNSPNYSYPLALSRGLVAGVGTFPLDIYHGLNWVSPQLGAILRQIPGAHAAHEFVEKPAQSTTEYLAGGLGELLSGLAIPEGLLERGLQAGTRRLLERQITKRTGAARPWVQPPGGGPMVQMRVPPSTTTKPGLTAAGTRAVKTAGKVGRAAEPALIGGAAGAAQNKEDRAKGFAEGILGGVAGKGAGRALHGAGELLSHMGPAITHHVGHAAGIPYYARSMATHTTIPRRVAQFAGRQLEKVGAVGRRPAVTGGATSRIMHGAGIDALHDVIRQIYEAGRASAAEAPQEPAQRAPLKFTVPGQP